MDERQSARMLTTAALAFVGVYGWSHGLAKLEVPEEWAVGIKLSIIAGLVITVQGFETSRYLSETHDGPTRIQTMKLAQWISTGIYVLTVGLIPCPSPRARSRARRRRPSRSPPSSPPFFR